MKIKRGTMLWWVNQVLYDKEPWDSFSEHERKSFSPYMINRFLSMEITYIDLVSYFQKFAVGQLNSKSVYEFYCDVLPKKRLYNKYIKSKNEDRYESWVIDIFCKYFEIGKSDIYDYLTILYSSEIGKQEVIRILEKHGIDKKEINKLKL